MLHSRWDAALGRTIRLGQAPPAAPEAYGIRAAAEALDRAGALADRTARNYSRLVELLGADKAVEALEQAAENVERAAGEYGALVAGARASEEARLPW